MFDEVFQKLSIMVGKAVLDHGQHIQGRVGEVLKPM